jgi:voltage-gated potassium channel Kch
MATVLYILKQTKGKRKKAGLSSGLQGGAPASLRRTKEEREELRRAFREGVIDADEDDSCSLGSVGSVRRALSATSLDSMDPRCETPLDEHWILQRLREKAQIARIRARERRRLRQTIDPNASWKIAWDLFVGVLIVYSVIIVPWRLAFEEPASGAMVGLDSFVDCAFGVDIVLTFFTSYMHKGRRITDRRKIAKRYLRGWFFLDLISTVPFDTIVTMVAGNGDQFRAMEVVRILRLFRLIKLVRVAKLDKFLKDPQVQEILHPGFVQLLNLMFKIVFLSHFVACMWWMLGSGCTKGETDDWQQCGNGSLGSAYLSSYYWATVTMITVGYGDIYSTSDGGRMYSMVVEMIGCGCFGYILATVTMVVHSFASGDSNANLLQQDVKEFCSQRQLASDLSRRVRAHFAYYYSSPSVRKPAERDTLSMLPPSVSDELLRLTSAEAVQSLQRSVVIKLLNEDLVINIAEQLMPFALLPGDLMVESGTVPSQVFFISKGVCHMVHDTRGEEDLRLIAGVCFDGCEIALYNAVCDQVMKYSVICTTACDLYFIEAVTLVDALALDVTAVPAVQFCLDVHKEFVDDVLGSDYVAFTYEDGTRCLVHDRVVLNGVTVSARAVHPCLFSLSPELSSSKIAHITSSHNSVSGDEIPKRQETAPSACDVEDVLFGMSHIVKRFQADKAVPCVGRETRSLRKANVATLSPSATQIPEEDGGWNDVQRVSMSPSIRKRKASLFPSLPGLFLRPSFRYHSSTVLPVEDNDFGVSSGSYVTSRSLSPPSVRRRSVTGRRGSRRLSWGGKSKQNTPEQLARRWNPLKPAEDELVMPKRVIDPSDPRKIAWDLFVGLLIMWSVITVPLRLGFDLKMTSAWNISDWSMDAIFLLDMVASFHTAYIDMRGGLVVDRKAIAKRYLRSWFVIDLASTLPIDKIVGWFMGGSSNLRSLKLIRTIRLIRLLKLVRIAKLGAILKNLEEYLDLTWIMKAAQLVVTLIMFAHFFGCFWSLVAVHEGGESAEAITWITEDRIQLTTVGSKYLASIYWALTTMTTVGYGDIIPVTDAERTYAVMVVLIGATLFSYIIGNLSALLATSGTSRNDATIAEVSHYLMAHSVNSHLSKQIVRQSEQNLEYTASGFDQGWILATLPMRLREEVALECYQSIIDHPSMPLLAMNWQGEIADSGDGLLSRQFVAFLAPMLQTHYTAAGSSILLPEAGPLGVYFLHQGQAVLTIRRYLTAKEKELEADAATAGARLIDIPGMIIEPGMSFGFNFMLSTEPELGVRALQSCSSYYLPLEVLGYITQRATFMGHELHLRIRAILHNTLERLQNSSPPSSAPIAKGVEIKVRKMRRSSPPVFIEGQPDFLHYMETNRVRLSEYDKQSTPADKIYAANEKRCDVEGHDTMLTANTDPPLPFSDDDKKPDDDPSDKKLPGSDTASSAHENSSTNVEPRLSIASTFSHLPPSEMVKEYISSWLLNLDDTLRQIFYGTTAVAGGGQLSRLQMAVDDLRMDAARHKESVMVLNKVKNARLEKREGDLLVGSPPRSSSSVDPGTNGDTVDTLVACNEGDQEKMLRVLAAFRSRNLRTSRQRDFLNNLKGIQDSSLASDFLRRRTLSSDELMSNKDMPPRRKRSSSSFIDMMKGRVTSATRWSTT